MNVIWGIFLFLLVGGNTSVENNPKHDGDDGTSFLSPEAVPFLSIPLKGNAKELRLGGEKKNNTRLSLMHNRAQKMRILHGIRLSSLSPRVNVFVLFCIMKKIAYDIDS